MRYWQSHGFEVLWVTLTSGIGVVPGRLRKDFDALRKRIGHRWGFNPLQYVCIETSEGNGVLHMLWAYKASKGAFYVPYNWLSDAWEELHGARQVWVARVGDGDSDRRRLSRYVVTQYCGGQDALVRVSQSRVGISLGNMRRAWASAARECFERYEQYQLVGAGLQWDVARLGRVCSQWFWHSYRRAWDELVTFGDCDFFGVRFVYHQPEPGVWRVSRCGG
jgi:hypothetical protein